MHHGFKSIGLLFTGIALLSGCGSKAVFTSPSPTPIPPFTPPATVANQWMWVSGSNSLYPLGTYGTLGTAAPANTPGSRVWATSWTDKLGNLWLFGGVGQDSKDSAVVLNDLWMFDGAQWTWEGGSSVDLQPSRARGVGGTYGTMGVASPSNYPGSRNSATSWTDGQGNFWLFGGEGFDSTGDDCWLNDLWRYSSGEWTWMSGPDVCVGLGSPGVYGTQGVAAPGNVPGGRLGANSWTDAQGNLWLFGGQGESSTTGSGALNDLWKYSGGQWTWMSGSNLINQYGAYGTLGVAASGNVPGARQWAVTWIDKSGNLWLFGGEGNGSPGNGGDLNDLWKYNPGNGQWTWMGGSDIGSQTGIYGTQGVAAPGNIPPGRDNAVAWTDAQGNFWLFGGYAFTSLDVLNDLWEYSGGQWTWVSGSNLPDEPGAYGTKGVSSPSNVPGAREGSVSWIDPSGNLWLFGGEGSGELNDLWVYQP